ncbi:MAG: hypothetical protein Q9164_006866 [Protoblastenia rupestris]
MSKASGSRLQESWKSPPLSEPSLSEQQKAKIVSQLGGITWQLSQLRFNQIGSLFEENGTYSIKQCLSRGLIMNERHSLDELHRGPFSSSDQYLRAHLFAFLLHAKYLPLNHHCFLAPIPSPREYNDYSEYVEATDRWNEFVAAGNKIDSSENRSDYVLARDILARTILEWFAKVPKIMTRDCQNPFPIHHPDLSVDNIYVDADFNITCIIDWAFCSSVPLHVLLMAPGLPQSRYELESTLISAFEDGFRAKLEDDILYKDNVTGMALIETLQRSRPIWLLSRFLDFDSLADYHLFKGVSDTIGPPVHNALQEFRTMQSLPQYTSLLRGLKEEDDPPEQVTIFERAHFMKDAPGRLAVARKLTMVSQWGLRYQQKPAYGIRANCNMFVADSKLWKWISLCLSKDGRDFIQAYREV